MYSTLSTGSNIHIESLGLCVSAQSSQRVKTQSSRINKSHVCMRVCADVNECAESRAACTGNAQCINVLGSFECSCPQGYKLTASLRSCQGIQRSTCKFGSAGTRCNLTVVTCHSVSKLTATLVECNYVIVKWAMELLTASLPVSVWLCSLTLNAYVVARTNSCKNVVLRGCGRLQGSISYFLTTMSSQMNVEAASDVDPKY